MSDRGGKHQGRRKETKPVEVKSEEPRKEEVKEKASKKGSK
jgi:hypothetical protein